MISNPLESRAQSGFPVSIGTGLALETIFEPVQSVYDEGREAPERIAAGTYTDYLINLSTIARNLMSSIPYKDLATTKSSAILNTFLEEVDYLTTLFEMHSLNVKFYVNSYAFVKSTYGAGRHREVSRLREAATDHQRKQLDLVTMCLEHAKKQDKVLTFNKDVKLDKTSKCLIMTHVPWDLLSHHNFAKLDLVESHTGIIKTRSTFNTKYFKFGNNDMSFLPFLEYLLTIFGDGVMFKPASIPERQKLYDAMVSRKVHPLMSEMSLML